MKLLGEIVGFVLWLVRRLLGRKDAAEPQRRIDEAREAALKGDDEKLNAALGTARDRDQLRNAIHGTTDSE